MFDLSNKTKTPPPSNYLFAKYSSNSTDFRCTLCPIGLFQNEFGQSICLDCPTGRLINQEGAADQSECQTCVEGWLLEGNKTCIPYSVGKYMNHDLQRYVPVESTI
jgi:hypothetical protein